MFLLLPKSLDSIILSEKGKLLANLIITKNFEEPEKLYLFLKENFSDEVVPDNFGKVTPLEINNQLRFEHEKYFNIKRIASNNTDLILENLCRSLFLAIEDCNDQGSNLPDICFINLWIAIQNVAAFLTLDSIPNKNVKEFNFSLMRKIDNPMQRWMRGHFLFFSLIQSLTLVHKRFDHHESSLKIASNLFLASISAFRYGTNYCSSDYQDIIRPSMQPPEYSPGFSDQNSLDHIELLSSISKVKADLLYDNGNGEDLKNYKNSISILYENHAIVCEKAVGNVASLQQDSQDNESNISAADTIRTTYKNRTLNLVPGCPFNK